MYIYTVGSSSLLGSTESKSGTKNGLGKVIMIISEFSVTHLLMLFTLENAAMSWKWIFACLAFVLIAALVMLFRDSGKLSVY